MGAAMQAGAGASVAADAPGQGRGLGVRDAVRDAREAGRDVGAAAREAGTALGGGETVSDEETRRRAQRRGPENASEQGLANSNERAGLRSGAGVAAELRSGMRLTDASGRNVGRIVQVVRSDDGAPSGVVVRAPGRGEITVPIDSVRLNGRVAVTALTAAQLLGL
jgi:hypothetical protein